MFSSGPNYQKFQTNLRLSINRLKLLEKKKTELGIKARKEISEYLQSGKIDRARIRVEHIIREDYLVEGMEIIELYCDTLISRIGLMKSQKALDPGLEKAVASIIWSSVRLVGDVPELKVCADELSRKYSKEFAMQCRTNALENVDGKLMQKLGVEAPAPTLVESYLEEIAKSYNVVFVPDPTLIHDDVLRAENLLIDHISSGNSSQASGQSNMHMPSPGYPAPIYPPYNNGIDGGQFPGIPSKGPVGNPNDINFDGAGAFLMPQPPQGFPSPSGPPPDIGFGSHNFPSPGPPPPGPGFIDTDFYEPPKYSSIDQNPVVKGLNATSPVFPDIPELPNVPIGNLSSNSNRSTNTKNDDVDFDDITKRFEELKKKK